MQANELETHRMLNQARQSCWTMRRTYEHNGHKIRATIKHDSYDFQCDFYAEVFNPRELKWNRVHTETTDWAKGFSILFWDKPTFAPKPEQLENIEYLFEHMVEVCEELLEGVPA